MLAHILAILVGFCGFALYMAAFFFPEVHRKNDFIWSGVVMFYALVLWVCAGRITGGVLLGQVASVTLLGWLGWQTLEMRRELTPYDQQTWVKGSSSMGDALWIKSKQWWSRLQQQFERLPLPAPVRQIFTRSQQSQPTPEATASTPVASKKKPVKRSPKPSPSDAKADAKPNTKLAEAATSEAATQTAPTDLKDGVGAIEQNEVQDVAPSLAQASQWVPEPVQEVIEQINEAAAEAATGAATGAVTEASQTAEPKAAPAKETIAPEDFGDDEAIEPPSADEMQRLKQASVRSGNRLQSMLGNVKHRVQNIQNGKNGAGTELTESAPEPATPDIEDIFELDDEDLVFELDETTEKPIDRVPDVAPVPTEEATTFPEFTPAESTVANLDSPETLEEWDTGWDDPASPAQEELRIEIESISPEVPKDSAFSLDATMEVVGSEVIAEIDALAEAMNDGDEFGETAEPIAIRSQPSEFEPDDSEIDDFELEDFETDAFEPDGAVEEMDAVLISLEDKDEPASQNPLSVTAIESDRPRLSEEELNALFPDDPISSHH